MKKKRIYKRYKRNKRGGQRYWVNYSSNTNIKYIPLEQAWEMRAKHAYPGDMSPKREQDTMQKIKEGISKGIFEPIPITEEEFKRGILTEGKHRLIIAKELGLKNVPIEIQDD